MEKNYCSWGKETGGTKRKKEKKEALVLVQHQIPAKYGARSHAAIARLGRVIVNTVTCFYSRGLATGFCAMFRI